MEQDLKKEMRKTKIQRAILTTVGIAGILSIAAVAPNALQLLGMFGLNKKTKTYRRDAINNSVKRLVEKKLLIYEKRKGKSYLRLTHEGEKILQTLGLLDYKIKKPKRWDKKYRIIIFDIKEERKITRNKLRNTLRSIGFFRLQDSVWVYPYDCEDFITLIKADFKIGRDVLYIIADRIENDSFLRRQFGLKE